MGTQRPVGEITRGTTNPNRLRRADRWLTACHTSLVRGTPERPVIVVDLGYGAAPVTTLEMAARLERAGARHTRVLGLEIDPARVAHAREVAARLGPAAPRLPVDFALGGFEIPTPEQRPVQVIRAFNVLRQYEEDQVPAAWKAMRDRLTPEGIIIDGTCNELGRRMTWVTLDARGPVSLSISLAFSAFETPSDVAERLPKALIHRNVPGQPVHAFLTDWDDVWARNGHLAGFGRRQRFIASARDLTARGWPLLGGPSRWRLGELTVAWEAVAPH